MVIKCPYCLIRLKTHVTEMGKKLKCPKCNHIFKLRNSVVVKIETVFGDNTIVKDSTPPIPPTQNI